MGMNLTTDIKKKENAIVLINVTIPKEEVAKQYDNALNKISNKAEIPGFRKGKAPKNIIINKFGKDIEYEALENMLNDAVKDVLDSNGIRICSSPKVTDMLNDFNVDNDFKFTFEVETMPSVELGNYKGIEYKKVKYIYEDEDTEERLRQIQTDESMVIDKEDEPSENGDHVHVEYTFFVDENKKEEPDGEIHFDIGKELDFNEEWKGKIYNELIGKKAGYENTFDTTIPENYPDKDIANKKGKLHFKIAKVERIETPELDDEFAKDLNYKSLDELRNDIKKSIENECEANSNMENFNRIIKQIVEASTFNIPETIIQEETEHQKEWFYGLFGKDADSIKNFFKSDESFPKIENRLRKNAIELIKKELVYSEISKGENLEPTDEEKKQKVTDFANEYGVSFEKMMKELEKEDAMYRIDRSIEMKKVEDFLINNSNSIGEDIKYYKNLNKRNSPDEDDDVEDDEDGSEFLF